MGNAPLEIYQVLSYQFQKRFTNSLNKDDAQGLHCRYAQSNNIFKDCCYLFSYSSPVLENQLHKYHIDE